MYFIPIYDHQTYQQTISPILVHISKKKYEIQELVDALRKLKIYSSSKKQEKIYDEFKESYKMLKTLYPQNEIRQIFAMMATFILNKEKDIKKHKIQVLQQDHSKQVVLNKSQVIFLLISMVLNILPPQQYAKSSSRKQKFCLTHSFSFIFSQEEYKTKTLISYFQYHFKNQAWKQRDEKFVIRRKCLEEPMQKIMKEHKKSKMGQFDLRKNNESIEDFKGEGKVDFANQYIGGGALYSGCVQEQIMFANHPELYVSMFLCQVMSPKQSIYLQGFRQFSNNKGYGFDTTFDETYKIDENTFYSTPQRIIAIDAFPFFASFDQYKKQMIDRQIIKAYAGFSNLPQKVNVVTGNWGCGVFGGQIKLKFIIQWLACSIAGKTMIYCPFGQGYKIQENQKVLDILKKMNVAEVYQILLKASASIQYPHQNIFKKIQQHLENKK